MLFMGIGQIIGTLSSSDLGEVNQALSTRGASLSGSLFLFLLLFLIRVGMPGQTFHDYLCDLAPMMPTNQAELR